MPLLRVSPPRLFSIPCASKWALLVLLADAVLTAAVVAKVPFTDIDWESYMAEVDFVLAGQYDYQEITSPNGPIAYPAGFVWFYGALRWARLEVRQVQALFAVIYLGMMVVLHQIYHHAGAPLWVFALCVLSKRVHSVFVLRLFNDAVAQFFCYAALLLFLQRRHLMCSLSYSLAVSIKMQPLLICPVVGLCLVASGGWSHALLCIACMLALQLVLAVPFLHANAPAYLGRAFGGPGDLQPAWSVNWRFLPEALFSRKELSILLLLVHVLLLLWFAQVRWIDGGFLSRTIRKWRCSACLSDQSVVAMWFTCNFIGIACLRTMHFQYLVWYFHTIPYLAYCCFGSGRLHHAAATAIITLLVEVPFIVTTHGEVRGPDGRRWTSPGLPTSLGSILLQATHWFLLFGLLVQSCRKGKTD
ncbi:ALG3 [Symbiodinium natans]|uniref:dolichyl-P-Man:Man5GlcNAc2-PP-dolichol alpha-1,3-mannosyltransferase n=1 Tax=Symbiodinium natans TaxID=878477 RepID=A0A812UFT7_9DINO|nr:ALG3 [Symbiodinium natans]